MWIIRKAFCFFFIILILAQSRPELLKEIWFFANRDWIARELCVNVNKPELKCAGSCYLKKILEEQQSENNKHALVETGQIIPLFYFFLESSLFVFNVNKPTKGKLEFPYIFNYSFKSLSSVFRPPS